MPDVRPADCYRLPWSLNDNVLAWLEPTKACNLYCEGCYSRNDPKSHKSLEAVRSDVEVILRQRKIDSISIAGGDPLTHPGIVDIVAMTAGEFGLKTVLNTNGMALVPTLCRELKDAGLHGFTFHVDSSQCRPYWKGKNERQLNELRTHYAQLCADVGGLSVAFNCTVFRHTLEHIPAVLDWAREHIDIVHGVVFILFRTSRTQEFAYYAQGQPADVGGLVYHDQDENPAPLVAQDVIAKLEEADPLYRPAAYLGGTKDPDSFKWLLAGRMGTSERTVGYVGPKYMEIVQTAHHAATGRYLGYVKPDLLAHGRSMLAGLGPFDDGVRDAAKRWLSAPRQWRDRVHFQSVLVIQPIDMMPDGEMNMCDGCPDMTVHEGRLVWSCRLDELQRHGCFLTATPAHA
jgi:pyruvate-formate lyase-activating enzyme